MASSKVSESDAPYISPRELVRRWRCSRSSVDRIACRAGFTRLYLGEGKNGMVRYLRREVVALERSKTAVRTRPKRAPGRLRK